jgi:basic amino acid/polyamine antiporter, APA family
MRFALPWLPTDDQVRSTESRSPRMRMPQSGSGNGLSAARPKEHLLRILGVGFGIAVIIGGVIGSGILRTPGLVAAQLRNPGLIIAVWLVGGIYAFCCTLSVTELGTMLPRAGGWYVYSRRAFGEYAGFLVGCMDWIANTVAIAYLAVAFGDFAAELQPSLHGYVKVVPVASVSGLTLLNWLGLRAGSRMQELTSMVKTLALIAVVVACFAISPHSAPDGGALPASLAAPKGGLLLAVLVALQAVIVTYDGWYFAIYFTEEDHDPARNLPRSSIGTILACITLYVLVNVALLHVLPMSKLAASKVPAADAAMAIFGGWGRQFILILAMVSAISALNAGLLLAPRILFGMARDGWLPHWVASVNSGGTPSAALLLVALGSIALILSGGYEKLIALASFLLVTLYLSGFCALFALRVREPDLPRPFKAWGYPWTNLFVLLASAGFLVETVLGDLKDALFTLILIALSYPVYFFAVARKGIPRR